MVIESIKPDILDLFASRYGIAISAEDGLWTWTGPCASLRAHSVLSDDTSIYWKFVTLPA